MSLRVRLYEDIGWLPSFFVYGLEVLAAQGEISLHARPGLLAPVSTEHRKWKSVLLELSTGTRERRLCIDLFDSAESLNPEAIGAVDRYFKFNYRSGIVDRQLAAHRSRVRPMGFHFPVRIRARERRLRAALWALRAGLLASRRPRPRKVFDDLRYAFDSVRRNREVLPTYEDYTRTLADDPRRENDLFWNVSWWPPHLDPEGASVHREAIMSLLDGVAADGEARLRYGFIDSAQARASVPRHVMTPTPTTTEYIGLVSRAKMSIVPLGVQRCFSHRVGEHLALRRFAVMERFANEAAVPLQDGVHTVFYDPDLSDLGDKLRYYLRHEAERERIAIAGRAYFDEHCAPDRQLRRMIDETLAS